MKPPPADEARRNQLQNGSDFKKHKPDGKGGYIQPNGFKLNG